jgi:hypothetical protein
VAEKLNESLIDVVNKEGDVAEFWRALSRFKDDPRSSLDSMFSIADQGSTLALYFIGDILLWGYNGVHNAKEGMICLQRASDQGSLEAAYQIGRAHYGWGDIAEAVRHFEELSARGFTPAMYSLATLYNSKKFGENYKSMSLKYYAMAAKSGNILAKKDLALKMIRGEFGFRLVIKGILMWISVIGPYIALIKDYPQSDRLRGAETSPTNYGVHRVTRPALLLLDVANKQSLSE